MRRTPHGEARCSRAGCGERVAFPGHARDRRPPQYRCPACRASVRAALRPGAPVVETRARGPLSSSAGGVTWVHLLAPTTDEAQQLASRFGWHPLDVEDVLSRRQRPKVDVYAGDEDGDGGYLFTVLHFPVYDKPSAG